MTLTGDDYGAPDLTPFTVNRPCYLANTLAIPTADATATLALSGGLTINNAKFTDGTTYLSTFQTGQLVELSVSGFNNHPFHLHVNRYQRTR